MEADIYPVACEPQQCSPYLTELSWQHTKRYFPWAKFKIAQNFLYIFFSNLYKFSWTFCALHANYIFRHLENVYSIR